MSKLNDRQCWLLIYLLTRYPNGIAESTRCPHSCDYNGRNYGCPGGIGMGNIQGLKKRGWVHSPKQGLWYLTEDGVLEAQKAAEDPRWAKVQS